MINIYAGVQEQETGRLYVTSFCWEPSLTFLSRNDVHAYRVHLLPRTLAPYRPSQGVNHDST
ncbi:MAG: hypothetical protein GY950_00170 [bacterium]|nr:hypothetical protein [bacterium]